MNDKEKFSCRICKKIQDCEFEEHVTGDDPKDLELAQFYAIRNSPQASEYVNKYKPSVQVYNARLEAAGYYPLHGDKRLVRTGFGTSRSEVVDYRREHNIRFLIARNFDATKLEKMTDTQLESLRNKLMKLNKPY